MKLLVGISVLAVSVFFFAPPLPSIPNAARSRAGKKSEEGS
jgi:hypothetical protein